jgi:UDP-N-acetylglucosamine 4,6-dehydratase
MKGSEVFVPRIPSVRVSDIAEALAPLASRRVIGIRPGKVHELLITEDEPRHAVAFDDHYAIWPAFQFWGEQYPRGKKLPPGFRYSSDRNDAWLSPEEIREVARPIEAELAR